MSPRWGAHSSEFSRVQQYAGAFSPLANESRPRSAQPFERRTRRGQVVDAYDALGSRHGRLYLVDCRPRQRDRMGQQRRPACRSALGTVVAVRLQACANGAHRPEEHPALPVTPAALAAEVQAVYAAGADGVHLHVKDAEGVNTLDGDALAAVLTAVRGAAPDLPVGVTTSAWSLPDPTDGQVRDRSSTTGTCSA